MWILLQTLADKVMTITEFISVFGFALTVVALAAGFMVNMGRRISKLEQDLSGEKARSITEDKNHSNIIDEIKADVKDIMIKLDELIRLAAKHKN